MMDILTLVDLRNNLRVVRGRLLGAELPRRSELQRHKLARHKPAQSSGPWHK